MLVWQAGALLVVALAVAGWSAAVRIRARLAELRNIELPAVAERSVADVFIDSTRVRILVTAGTERVPFRATRDAILSDAALWQRMQIADWNTVPGPLRSAGLDAMLRRYRDLVLDPGTWDRMDAFDWDRIPHPIRALAFRHMTEYWAGFYQVGAAFDLPRQLVADTLEAIVMSESWFDHRAVNTAPWGNRDLGLAQASDRAREELRALYEAGLADVAFTDDEYFNPWNATRFVAVWFDLLLDATAGDLELAIRAYHRGLDRAMDPQGDAYLEAVLRRRRRFIRNSNAPPAWDYLWRRDRELQRKAWPWLWAD